MSQKKAKENRKEGKVAIVSPAIKPDQSALLFTDIPPQKEGQPGGLRIDFVIPQREVDKRHLPLTTSEYITMALASRLREDPDFAFAVIDWFKVHTNRKLAQQHAAEKEAKSKVIPLNKKSDS